MLKENWRFISRVERAGDVIIVVAAFIISYYGRGSLVEWDRTLKLGLPFAGDHLAPLKDYFVVLLVALLGYLGALSSFGAYGSMRLFSHVRVIRMMLSASLVVFFLLAATLFLLKIDLSRAFIILFCVLATLLLTAQRYAVLKFLRYWRRKGRNFRTLIIVGSGHQAAKLGREIMNSPELGIRVAGFAELGEYDERRFQKLRVLLGDKRTGRIIIGKQQLEVVLREQAVDEVIFTDVVEVMPTVEEMIQICAEQGIRTTIAADLFSVGIATSGLSHFAGMPLIHYQTPPGDRWELGVKRGIDMVLSLVLLVVLAPLFAVIALAIKATSPGPVFFKQKRVGLNGRLFSMYKFRSMCAGAEQQRDELMPRNEMRGPAFKIKNDPRVTKVGRVLRRFSLDELPQIWNVLRGDMSLVGPRPPVPGEVQQYERRYRRRLSMRPGMTCIWQVSGRNDIEDFDSWVKLDLEYIDNWSLGRDFLLLLRTIPAVMFGTGAR